MCWWIIQESKCAPEHYLICVMVSGKIALKIGQKYCTGIGHTFFVNVAQNALQIIAQVQGRKGTQVFDNKAGDCLGVRNIVHK